jgi:predicted nucleic acid-binding protein
VIVADTNLLVQLVVGGPQLERARAVFERDHEWSAPVLWRSEFTNVLAKFLRSDELSVEGAAELYHRVEELLSGREYFVPAARVIQLLTRSPCSAYDCEFVALAQVLGTRLVTSDQEILRAFPDVAIAPEGFVEGGSS